MNQTAHQTWGHRLDSFCAVLGGLLPLGIVIGNTGFEAVIGLVGFGWLLRIVIVKENPFQNLARHSLALPWFLWYASVICSLAINGAGSKGWAHDIVFIRHLLYVFALWDISFRRSLSKYFFYGIVAGVLLAAFNTLSAYVMGRDFLGRPLIRYAGKLKEGARIAGMMAYLFPMLIAWGLSKQTLSTKQNRISLIVGLVALGLLFQTHIRTAILSSFAGLLFFIACLSFRRFTVKIASSIAAVLLLISGATLLYIIYNQSLTSIYDRVYIWKVSWALWLDNPVWGVGVSAFQDAYKTMAASGKVTDYIAPDGSIWNAAISMHSHNLILMILSSTGLIGMASFIFLMFRSFTTIMKQTVQWRNGLLLWPVIFLVTGLTGWNIYTSWYQALFAFLVVLIIKGN